MTPVGQGGLNCQLWIAMCKRLIEGLVSSSSNEVNIFGILDIGYFRGLSLFPVIMDEPVRGVKTMNCPRGICLFA